MLYFNIDFGFRIFGYTIEASFMLRNWEWTRGVISDGIIRHISIGPIHLSITDRKKLKELLYVKNEE